MTRLDLRHFKCFRDLKLPLGSLTLLSGANASGKSSVLQALALLQQTMRGHEWSRRLVLNGVSARLGVVSDVVDQVYGRRECSIGLVHADGECRWRFSGGRREMSMEVSAVRVNGMAFDNPMSLRHLMPVGAADRRVADRIEGLTYLTAERTGAHERCISLEDPNIAPVVGPTGDGAVGVLHSGRDEDVLSGLRIDEKPPTLWWQVVARMERFFPGCGLLVEKIPHANAATLGLRTSPGTDFHRPINTGFGLTQVLPLVVAAVSAKRDDLLLIENPEVHLHPSGQAAMGEFLVEGRGSWRSGPRRDSQRPHSQWRQTGREERCAAARRGVAAFLPAHARKPIRARALRSRALQSTPPGNVDAWPEGFFDQFDKDTSFFAGW